MGTVPTVSIVFMGISLALSLALPIGLCIWFRRKKHADLLPFFIGFAVMILFAFVLESLVHNVVLNSAAGAKLRDNIWLYALYGGAMAGLFEETGRFIAFKTVLRKKQGNDANALMYGAGHGGIEMIIVLGITSINNIIYAVLINSGSTALLTGPLSGDLLKQVEDVLQTMIDTPSWQFLLGSVERILAVILQIALSVLVWFAAKKKDRLYLYPLAILIHFIVDGAAAVLSGLGVYMILIEVVIAAMTAAAAVIARRVRNRNAEAPCAAPASPPGPLPEGEL